VDEGIDLRLVGHVTPARHDFHPEWCGQVRGLFQQIQALTRTEEQVCPFFGKGQRTGAAMIPRGSGNEHDFPG
jgi:hypothetical protein